eukprot:Em0016g1069a
MATAYHLEALRKQRVLDRAYEASQKLQQSFETCAEVESLKPQDFAQQHENGGPEHKDGTRPPSGSTRSRPQSALGRVSTSPPHLTTNEGSSSLGANKPTVSDQMAVETKGSRPSSARSHSDSTHGRSLDSAEAPGPSRQATSRPSSSSARSSRAESRIAAIRRDLKKQEIILHNSNLVMGPLSVDQELSDRATPHKILP